MVHGRGFAAAGELWGAAPPREGWIGWAAGHARARKIWPCPASAAAEAMPPPPRSPRRLCPHLGPAVQRPGISAPFFWCRVSLHQILCARNLCTTHTHKHTHAHTQLYIVAKRQRRTTFAATLYEPSRCHDNGEERDEKETVAQDAAAQHKPEPRTRPTRRVAARMPCSLPLSLRPCLESLRRHFAFDSHRLCLFLIVSSPLSLRHCRLVMLSSPLSRSAGTLSSLLGGCRPLRRRRCAAPRGPSSRLRIGPSARLQAGAGPGPE